MPVAMGRKSDLQRILKKRKENGQTCFALSEFPVETCTRRSCVVSCTFRGERFTPQQHPYYQQACDVHDEIHTRSLDIPFVIKQLESSLHMQSLPLHYMHSIRSSDRQKNPGNSTQTRSILLTRWVSCVYVLRLLI